MMDANGNGNDMADALGTPSASTSSSTPIAQARTGKLQGLLKSQCQDPGSGGSSVSSPTPIQKKSVSFLSSSFDKGIRVIDAPDCVNYMRDGTELLKIRSSGRHFKRFFFLDTETMEIRWHPSSKKRQKAKLPIDQLKEVRRGRTSAILKDSEVAAAYPADCAFTVIYGEDFLSMDLVAVSLDDANVWVTGLTCLINGRPGQLSSDTIEKRQLMRDRWLEEVFSAASLDEDGFLDEQDVIQLMKKLNSGVNTSRIKKKLKEVDIANAISSRGRLSSSEFVNLFKEISTRPEVYFLLVRYSSDGDYLSTEDLLMFLEAEQGNSKVSKEKCSEIINQFEPSTEGRAKGQLGIDGFTAFLQSEFCDIFDPEHLAVCQDMEQPLTHYFINSSHNTYLLEDQLKGKSSVEGYEKALKSQVRYIELEVWNGPNDEPIIYHGHTLTSKIGLRDVLDTVRQFAFYKTDMPLILSIENHCSLAQQCRMVQLIRSTLGDWLLDPGSASESDVQLLSDPRLLTPSRLRRRILVKCKKLPPPPEGGASAGCERQVATVQQSAVAFGYVSEEDDNVDIQRDRSPKAFKKAGNQSHQSLQQQQQQQQPPPPPQQQQQCGRRIKLSQELSDLAALGSERFADLDDCCFHFYKSDSAQAASRRQPDHQQQHQLLHQQVWSISESAAFRLAQSDMDGLVEYSRRCLVQVQPNAIRVDSSNYNPQDMWSCGCQLVCLNHQTPGLMTDLNRGQFSKNGSCGFVLKPGAMRQTFAFLAQRGGGGSDLAPHSLHIRVISGSQLPKPRGSVAKGDVTDPCVVVEVFGLPADCSEERTKTVHGNGYNPVFDECFEFRVSLPELALLRLVVLDDDAIGDDFIGQFTIPFDCIQTGYRHVRLLDSDGEPLPEAHLFLHVAVTNRHGGGRLGKRSFASSNKKSSNSTNFNVGSSLEPNLKARTSSGGSDGGGGDSGERVESIGSGGGYPRLRPTGFRDIDDAFKAALPTLREAAGLREGFDRALAGLQDACGLSHIANVKQCVRVMAARASSCAAAASSGASAAAGSDSTATSGPQAVGLRMICKASCPCLEALVPLPEPLKKSLVAFEQLVTESKKLMQLGPGMHTRLQDCEAACMQFYDDLAPMCSSAGYKPRKVAKIADSFAWNVRVLRGQADLLARAVSGARCTMVQAEEAGEATGLAMTAV
ncbi:hypothetical protein BOX15_Mlig023826g1 [Macrostomum lignano]|uniref:Phosphoinositide phospholipase C n=2 Tax=Macrostomum lignano TaxID=282301 RepID=A0A1I8H5P4_9PLAT|nr:hypothetical protein BOX15_Mlig023826g1 [Macrostomum lignano]